MQTLIHVRNGEYASKVAYNFDRSLEDARTTVTPVELYRSVLSSASDHSVKVISIGFLTNLAELLRSPADDHSSRSGKDLSLRKLASSW